MSRATMKAALATATAAGVMLVSSVVATAPASAGISRCLQLKFLGNTVETAQLCGPSGTYHVDVWYNGGPRESHGRYYYGGGKKYDYWRSVASGTGVCAELWYHKPGGGYESWGLPCVTKP